MPNPPPKSEQLRVTVFQNLFIIAGFLSLFAILPALLMRMEDVEEAEERAVLAPLSPVY